ncbi:G-type lectin S-receptor-like serine/threonine-protein kinase B120, partial [Linum perenne]
MDWRHLGLEAVSQGRIDDDHRLGCRHRRCCRIIQRRRRWMVVGVWKIPRCLRNCSCSAYAYEGNCSVWYGELLNLKEVAQNGKTIYVKLAASEFSNMKDSSNGVVIGVVVRSIIFLAIVGLIVLIVLRR